jgi:hypothetical protein
MELHMNAYASVTYTRHTGKRSKIERSQQVTFDLERYTIDEAASAIIESLTAEVRDARARRRYRSENF